MTHIVGAGPDDIAGLFQVLSHPDHQRGLDSDRTLTVLRLEQRAAALVRLTGEVSGAGDLEGWTIPNAAVRLELPGTPGELQGIAGAPTTTSRVYTLAEVDPRARTVSIDIVRHPEASPAMRWLDEVRPGDGVPLIGPRPHRVPGPGRPRILLADSSALPAVLSILRRQPRAGDVLIVAAAPGDEVQLLRAESAGILGSDGRLEIRRVEPSCPLPLSRVFATLDVPAGASVWASGEREDMRAVRARCRQELGLAAESAQVFGYWKRGTTHTRLDLARLQATRNALVEGRPFDDTDDFEIGI